MPFSEPNMSDNTLLVSVEDLINMGLGPPHSNIVNFKVVQTVLHILARQQRMLQQRVEIRITERRQEHSPEKQRPPSRKTRDKDVSEPSIPKSPRSPRPRMTGIQEEHDKAAKEKAKAEKEAQKEKERALKAQEKGDKTARKEKEKTEKAQQKEAEKAQKDKEKAEGAASKDREKSERASSKEREKEERAKSKEREKEERAASREREKGERAASREREKEEKAERKERERIEKEAAKVQKEKERSEMSSARGEKKKIKAAVESTSSINISEVERGKEKVLIVEKGPTTRSDTRSRGGSIDVVTQSQFALLEAAVKGLMEKTGPMPELRMPDNKQLRGDLAKGSASLTDTMQAMQVNARVKAAEEAIERMAGLLTQLAAAGALPEDMATQLEEVKQSAEVTATYAEEMPMKPRPSMARKSVAIDPMVKTSQMTRASTARASSAPTPRGSISTVMTRPSIMTQPSSTVASTPQPGVTRGEMEDVIKAVKDDLWKNMNNLTTRAMTAAETALHTAKGVAEKLEIALKLDTRISSLYSLVSDYAEQLSGFDAGLTTQMQSFQEQIVQIRNDLKSGLTLLEGVNNNAETAAVMELNERYEDLVTELDKTIHAHQALTAFQAQLGDELHVRIPRILESNLVLRSSNAAVTNHLFESLVECVEMLREEKADRDEVIDGLRDKADTSRLAGLLTETDFAAARAELTQRLNVCHEKFHRQDLIWMGAIKDLLKTTDQKAEFIDLLSMKDDTQLQLQELLDKLKLLAIALGEPKAALLTRKLAAGASCGACGAAALMPMMDPSTGVPPALPALRPAPPAPPPDQLCLEDMMPEKEDERHICHRWCGGSHTLVSEHVTREQASPLRLDRAPTRKFVGHGFDGRLYMMEEDLEPCLECNVLLEKTFERPPPIGDDGAGDTGGVEDARKSSIAKE